MDEPQELGGGNQAMNPVELLLSALGGYMTICAVSFAPACGVRLDRFGVGLEATSTQTASWGSADTCGLGFRT